MLIMKHVYPTRAAIVSIDISMINLQKNINHDYKNNSISPFSSNVKQQIREEKLILSKLRRISCSLIVL